MVAVISVTWLVSSKVSLTSWGEDTSLALVGQPSIDQLHNPSFPIGLVKTKSDFIVRSVDTGLER